MFIPDNGRGPPPAGDNVVWYDPADVPEDREAAAEFFRSLQPAGYGVVMFVERDDGGANEP